MIDCTTIHSKKQAPSRKRSDAISKVIDYIRAIPSQHTPDISELCKISSVSERTLQYAFMERYKITPVGFVRAWKLNLVRQTLLYSDPMNTKISDIAKDFGFNHQGQFSTYYKQLFTELPGETLRK